MDMDNVRIERAPFCLGLIVDGRWLYDSGIDENAQRGASVTDMDPPRDDGVTEVQYAFVYVSAIYALHLVGLHRHGDPVPDDVDADPPCEQIPSGEYDGTIPEPVRDIVARFTDAPVATPDLGEPMDEDNLLTDLKDVRGVTAVSPGLGDGELYVHVSENADANEVERRIERDVGDERIASVGVGDGGMVVFVQLGHQPK